MILRADFRAENAALLSQGKNEKRKDAGKAPLRAGSGNSCYPIRFALLRRVPVKERHYLPARTHIGRGEHGLRRSLRYIL